MSVHVTYDWSGWGSVSERWLIQRDAYGMTTRVQVVDAPDVKARLPELLPVDAMAAFEAALQAAPLTREATPAAGRMLVRPAACVRPPGAGHLEPAGTCRTPF
ncbi:hypothetical protein G6F53_014075 [Rhizopus delemar]|nr:hypothetical protein G6F53_014075 [Rhizopus delemar]